MHKLARHAMVVLLLATLVVLGSVGVIGDLGLTWLLTLIIVGVLVLINADRYDYEEEEEEEEEHCSCCCAEGDTTATNDPTKSGIITRRQYGVLVEVAWKKVSNNRDFIGPATMNFLGGIFDLAVEREFPNGVTCRRLEHLPPGTSEMVEELRDPPPPVGGA